MKLTTYLAVGAGLLATAPAAGQSAQDTAGVETASAPTTRATFVDAKGNEIGTATLMQTSQGVLVEVEVRGLPPGEHGFHFHETGRCEPPSFESAGAHYAPKKNQHGFLAKNGPHAGDMPNAHALGLLKADEYNPFVSLSGGEAPLLDSDGSALVIHAKPDDYKSQPAGDSGDRIACAVISKSGAE
jgi:superoxide dismutase, Cu-Zn family